MATLRTSRSVRRLLAHDGVCLARRSARTRSGPLTQHPAAACSRGASGRWSSSTVVRSCSIASMPSWTRSGLRWHRHPRSWLACSGAVSPCRRHRLGPGRRDRQERCCRRACKSSSRFSSSVTSTYDETPTKASTSCEWPCAGAQRAHHVPAAGGPRGDRPAARGAQVDRGTARGGQGRGGHGPAVGPGGIGAACRAGARCGDGANRPHPGQPLPRRPRRSTGGDGVPRYFALLTALDELAASPPWTPLAEDPVNTVLPRLLRRDWRRLRKRVALVGAATDQHGRDVALHESRKAAKRLRHAAEAARPVLGKDAKRWRVQPRRRRPCSAITRTAW